MAWAMVTATAWAMAWAMVTVTLGASCGQRLSGTRK